MLLMGIRKFCRKPLDIDSKSCYNITCVDNQNRFTAGRLGRTIWLRILKKLITMTYTAIC